MNELFVFIDGLNLYCNNGNKTKLLKKDIREARKRGMSNDDIKIAAYKILTSIDITQEYLTEKIND